MSTFPKTFRTIRPKLGPRWLTTGEGGLVFYSLDLVKDAFVDRLFAGHLSRFPQNDASGDTTAPSDALAAMGRQRQVVRGINESEPSYARRLVAWLDDRPRQGNPWALMKKLSEYTGPLPSFRTVDVRGNWFSRAADGTETVVMQQANWDWDGDPDGLDRWSRFWVIIYPNGLWTEGYDWGDPAGPNWGQGTGSIGSTASSEEVATIRSIVAEWKPGGTRCINIILAFDPASFDPVSAVSDPGMPNGLWEHWSRNVGGVQVPARLSTARYWDGVT